MQFPTSETTHCSRRAPNHLELPQPVNDSSSRKVFGGELELELYTIETTINLQSDQVRFEFSVTIDYIQNSGEAGEGLSLFDREVFSELSGLSDLIAFYHA